MKAPGRRLTGWGPSIYSSTDRPVSRFPRRPNNLMPPATKSPADKTRDRILKAAEEVFAQKGYHDAPVEEIGQVTALSKGGIYFHFPSKEELFFAVLDRLAGRLVARAERAAAAAPAHLPGAEAALDAVINALARRRRIARLLLLQGYSMGNAFHRKRAELFDRFASVLERRLDLAVRSGEIEPINTEVAARAWLGATSEVVIHWLYSGGPPPDKALPTLRRMFANSFTRPSGKGSTR